MTMMTAVRCHRFALVQEKKDQEVNNKHGTKNRQVFLPRKAPLKIRECLQLDNIPTPVLPQQGDWVLIQTEFAGVQYPDFLCATGTYQAKPPLPYVPGMDVVGRVLQVSGSSELQSGDRVVAFLLEMEAPMD